MPRVGTSIDLILSCMTDRTVSVAGVNVVPIGKSLESQSAAPATIIIRKLTKQLKQGWMSASIFRAFQYLYTTKGSGWH